MHTTGIQVKIVQEKLSYAKPNLNARKYKVSHLLDDYKRGVAMNYRTKRADSPIAI